MHGDDRHLAFRFFRRDIEYVHDPLDFLELFVGGGDEQTIARVVRNEQRLRRIREAFVIHALRDQAADAGEHRVNTREFGDDDLQLAILRGDFFLLELCDDVLDAAQVVFACGDNQPAGIGIGKNLRVRDLPAE